MHHTENDNFRLASFMSLPAMSETSSTASTAVGLPSRFEAMDRTEGRSFVKKNAARHRVFWPAANTESRVALLFRF